MTYRSKSSHENSPGFKGDVTPPKTQKLDSEIDIMPCGISQEDENEIRVSLQNIEDVDDFSFNHSGSQTVRSGSRNRIGSFQIIRPDLGACSKNRDPALRDQCLGQDIVGTPKNEFRAVRGVKVKTNNRMYDVMGEIQEKDTPLEDIAREFKEP